MDISKIGGRRVKTTLWAPLILILFLLGCAPETNDTDQPTNEESEQITTTVESDSGSLSEQVIEEIEPIIPAPSEKELDELAVHYINAGQADATLLTFSDEGEDFAILLDAGNWNANDVVRYLHGQQIKHLDVVVGTHPHADHIGQIDKIIEQMEVDEVWLSGDTANSKVFNRLLDTIERDDIGYYEPRAGDVFDVGPMEIEVFNPTELTGNVHEGSVSMKMVYGDISFLFTGDAEAKTEQKMVDSGVDLKANFLQLGHHGSKTSTTTSFLEAVDPEVAIISAGKDSQYGHPNEEVVSRVADKGIEIYETSVQGSIVVVTDGKTYTIAAVKSDVAKVAPEEPPAAKTEDPIEKTPLLTTDCVDINSVSYEDLLNIIHIGPARAHELLELRPFDRVEDLDRINGIGPSRIADILAEGRACTGG